MRSSSNPRLGEFQYRFLRAVVRLGSEAFGPTIHQLLEEEVGRINPGQIYTTADRLMADGLLTSKADQPQKSGRRATLFSCTEEGRKALALMKEHYRRLAK
jgi:DNA-binding PadR family transcriptional regulator